LAKATVILKRRECMFSSAFNDTRRLNFLLVRYLKKSLNL
jgi:hypothetical protein